MLTVIMQTNLLYMSYTISFLICHLTYFLKGIRYSYTVMKDKKEKRLFDRIKVVGGMSNLPPLQEYYSNLDENIKKDYD